MSDPDKYFAGEAATRAQAAGSWVRWDELDPLVMVPGLTFQPIVGDKVMANVVSFEPHTEAPVHWHDEEQFTYVMDGEFEFTVAGETRLMRRGDAVVIPPNVPHGGRSGPEGCEVIDVFTPPRAGILAAMT